MDKEPKPRKRKSDKKKRNFEHNGKYSAKHIRITEILKPKTQTNNSQQK